MTLIRNFFLYPLAGLFILASIATLVDLGGILFGKTLQLETPGLSSFNQAYAFFVICMFLHEDYEKLFLQRMLMYGIFLALVAFGFVTLVLEKNLDPLVIGVYQAGSIVVSSLAIFIFHKGQHSTLTRYWVMSFILLFGMFLPALYLGASASTGVSQEGIALFYTLIKYLSGIFISASVGFAIIYNLREPQFSQDR